MADRPRRMKIVIVTDAWKPQVNGVVTTLTQTIVHLRALDHEVEMITPEGFKTIPCPSEKELRLALLPGRRVGKRLDELQPDAVHVATEGPLGWAARRHCRKRGWDFTTSYCTKFPEYAHMRMRMPLRLGHWVMRRFHAPASRVLVSTPTLRQELVERGYPSIGDWPRGVDTDLFRPREKSLLDLPRPIAISMGRVAIEKNIEAFLTMEWEGSKVVIGDGPDFNRLRANHPGVHFLGFKHGEDLAMHLASGDVFVFPSKTDTFGLVMLEALACGVPVAAHPVPGPIDAITDERVGVLDEDLALAAKRALSLNPEDCRVYAEARSWRMVAERFAENLLYIPKHAHATHLAVSSQSSITPPR